MPTNKLPEKKAKITPTETVDECSADISSVFVQVIKPTVEKIGYIPYTRPGNQDVEDKALSVGFHLESSKASFDITGDDMDMIKRQKSQVKWDQKKMKFTKNSEKDEKMVKAEDGSRVKASYKTGRYKDWMDKSKSNSLNVGDKEDTKGAAFNTKRRNWHYTKSKGGKGDLKSVDSIIKDRKVKAKNKYMNSKKNGPNKTKNTNSGKNSQKQNHKGKRKF